MSIVYNTNIIKDGLVLHLDAANVKSYPGSGTTWFDLSNNQNNFIISGADFVDTPHHFSFVDNQNDYIVRSTTDVIGNLNDISLEIWLRVDIIQNEFVILSYAAQADDNAFLIHKNGTSINLWYKASMLTVDFDPANFQVGNFIQFVFTRVGTSVKIYVNAEEKVSSNSYFSGNISTGGTLIFGQEQDSPGGSFSNLQDLPGDISSIKIYNKVLTDSEIRQNFEALRGRYSI